MQKKCAKFICADEISQTLVRKKSSNKMPFLLVNAIRTKPNIFVLVKESILSCVFSERVVSLSGGVADNEL